MNNKVIIHGCWAGAVVLAFGLGFWGQAWRSADAVEEARQMILREQARSSGGSRADDDSDRAAKRDLRRGGSGTDSMLADLFGSYSLAAGGIETLARQALRDPNPVVRRLAFSRLLEGMTRENAREMREHLIANGIDDQELRDFQYSWGALAGREAFDSATESEERDMDATMAGWAAANPNEAIALLDNLPEELRGQRDDLAESVVAGLADRDRAQATELVLRLAGEGHGDADDLIGIVAGEAMRADGLEAASRWAETLPDGPLKGEAMEEVAGDYASRDPAAAAAWVERVSGQDYARDVIEEVGEEWAERDPQSAVAWLEKLPEGRGQSQGLSAAFREWEDEDPAAAAEYLLTMADSAQRDSAISGFTRGYAWQDPQAAIAWAQDISNPEVRLDTLTQAGQAFYRREPELARAWLAGSGLPPEAQQQILNPRRR